MRRRLSPLVPVAALALLVALPRPAAAIPNFWKQFEAKYVTGNGNKPVADALAKAKCNVCHVAEQKKTERNAYGAELSKLLDKKADKDAVDKIKKALDTVAAKKSAAGAPFGELITPRRRTAPRSTRPAVWSSRSWSPT